MKWDQALVLAPEPQRCKDAARASMPSFRVFGVIGNSSDAPTLPDGIHP